MLANEIKIYYLHNYYTLNTTLKFNFEPLFDFIKNFEKYMKQSIQNSWKKVRVFISPFSQQLCGSTLDIPIIAAEAHLGLYSARPGKLTDLSRSKLVLMSSRVLPAEFTSKSRARQHH